MERERERESSVARYRVGELLELVHIELCGSITLVTHEEAFLPPPSG
jgi:hypothetical protein